MTEVLTLVLFLTVFVGPAPQAIAASHVPQVGAASGILIDSSDGRTLWEKQADKRRAIASTTKILTALVVIERTKPAETVKVSAKAERVGEGDSLLTELELTEGERLTVEQLLYGLLLPSANDAAVALAEHVGGSVAGFAKLMNQKAKNLGAVQSRFSNSNGVDEANHYSTAHDLAVISRAAMKNALFAKIVATRSYTIPRRGLPAPSVVVNRNELLGQFSGVNGIKTGQTRASGKSLVTSARRGKEERILVLLASSDPVGESRTLLDYGFKGFRRFQVTEDGKPWGYLTYGDGATARLVARLDASVLVPSDEDDPPSTYDPARRIVKVDVPGGLNVPVTMSCPSAPCPDHGQPGGLLAGFMSMLAPLLALAR